MAKFYTPEQWAQLSDSDKKAFFKGLWPEEVQGKDEGGDAEDGDEEESTQQPMIEVAPSGTLDAILAGRESTGSISTPQPTPSSAPQNMSWNVPSPSPVPTTSVPTQQPQDMTQLPPVSTQAPAALGSAPGRGGLPAFVMPTSGAMGPQKTEKSTTTSGVPGAGHYLEREKAANEQIADAYNTKYEVVDPNNPTKKVSKTYQEIQQDAANANLAALQARQKNEDDYQKSKAAADTINVAALKEQETRYQNAMNDAAKMSIDPNKFWKDQGTVGSIFAAISMGLGAYASAMTGTKNTAVELIDRAIERDIDAQKTDAEKARSKVGQEQNLYQMMRERFKDDDAAREATRSAMWRKVGGDIELANARAKAAGIPADLDIMRAEAEKKDVESEARIASLGPRTTTETITQPTNKFNQPLDPKTAQTELSKLVDSKVSIDAYDNLISKVKSGEMDTGRLKAIGQALQQAVFNKNDPNYNTNANVLALNMLEANRPIFGRVNMYEMQTLAKQYPTMWDSPENFASKLEPIRDNIGAKHDIGVELLRGKVPDDKLALVTNKIPKWKMDQRAAEIQKSKKK